MPAEAIIITTFLEGWQRFVAGVQAEAAAMEEMGVATRLAGDQFEKTSAKSFAMTQGLFTMRRVVYAGTLALLAAGAAALRLGWSYTSAMQTASVALRPVFSSTRALHDELTKLFNLSAFTPFQFKDITIAFRQMYLAMHPLGISVATVNTTIHALTDALSATGRTSPAALNRVAVALQHMAYMGHLTGQVVLQLARDGLPIYAALQKELGLNAQQLHNIGSEGITSAQALHALNSYIETTPGFMNAAFRQATGTLVGAWTTFKDLLSQAVGSSNAGIFGAVQRTLKGIDQALVPFTKKGRAITLTDFVSAIDQILSPRTHAVLNFFELLRGTLQGVTWIFKTLALAVSGLLWPLGLLGSGTGATSWTMRRFGNVIGLVVIPALILYKTVAISAKIATALLTVATKAGALAMMLYETWVLRAEYAQLLATKVTALYEAAMWVLTAATGAATAALGAATAAAWAFTVALLANPITWIVLAVVALVGGLVLLYFKWRAFRDLVNNTWDWIRGHWMLLGAILIGPFAVAALEIVRHFDAIKSAVIKFWNWVKHLFSEVLTITVRLALPGSGILHGIEHAGSGILHGIEHPLGSAEHLFGLGGHHAPSIKPHAVRTLQLAPVGGILHGAITVHVHPQDIHLDGHKIASTVATHVTDKEARL